MDNNYFEENEINEPKEEVTDLTPPYVETIKKPKKEKKNLLKSPFFVSLITATFVSLFFIGLFYTSLPAIKESLLSGINTETKVDIPGASSFVSSGEALTKEEVAAIVSPSIVGISNLAIPYNSYLNLNSLQGTGSGIIISTEGYIVTNNHVIDNANKIRVTLSSGDEVDAKLIGKDPQTDIAVIKIDPKGLDLTAVTFGSSSALSVGEEVIAIGNPLGLTLSGSVTHGIVSALNRKLTVEGVTYNLIQTDAAINSGNSGGALLNCRGEVIGINSVKIASDGVEGLGFAIPIDDVRGIIEDLINVGYVKGRPSIGVNIVEVTPQLAYYYNLSSTYGLFVNDVITGSSADVAGIEVGDIIIAFNGKKIETSAQLIEERDKYKAGDTVEITVDREGRQKNISVKLQEDRSITQ